MTPVTERFWAKVEKTDGCWFWRAYLDAAGYGRFTPHRGESPKPAHRFARRDRDRSQGTPPNDGAGGA